MKAALESLRQGEGKRNSCEHLWTEATCKIHTQGERERRSRKQHISPHFTFENIIVLKNVQELVHTVQAFVCSKRMNKSGFNLKSISLHLYGSLSHHCGFDGTQ